MAGLGEAVGKLIKGNSYLIVLAALILIAGTETFVSKDNQMYRDIDYLRISSPSHF